VSERETGNFDLDERLTNLEAQLPELWNAVNRPAGLSFGPKEHQALLPDVASMLLTMWHERQPAQFGTYLAEVMTGTPPNGRKPRA
jgi:hypothetical protein